VTPPTLLPSGPQTAACGDILRWRAVIRGNTRELRAMRRWVETLLPDGPARHDVITVATELATNAVKFTASAQGWFAVQITWYPSIVRVAVEDGGAPEGPYLVDDPGAEYGRGLQMVRALSTRSGVCGDWRGRLAWADVPWTQPGDQPPRPGNGPEATIRDGLATLTHRHPGVTAWFGRATLRWWASPGPGRSLLSAPSAGELASLLDQAPAHPAASGIAIRPSRG
jgi:hypothetical protein